jgi:hypothetical protein
VSPYHFRAINRARAGYWLLAGRRSCHFRRGAKSEGRGEARRLSKFSNDEISAKSSDASQPNWEVTSRARHGEQLPGAVPELICSGRRWPNFDDVWRHASSFSFALLNFSETSTFFSVKKRKEMTVAAEQPVTANCAALPVT